jgi:hypothetical protein
LRRPFPVEEATATTIVAAFGLLFIVVDTTTSPAEDVTESGISSCSTAEFRDYRRCYYHPVRGRGRCLTSSASFGFIIIIFSNVIAGTTFVIAAVSTITE